MKTNLEQPWIEAGYELFSEEGPSALKIDLLARMVGISRSSFYHHFADLEVFEEKLLEYHAQRTKQAVAKVKRCNVMDPDFVMLVIEEKDYILFNRQLRIHRDNTIYKKAFEKGTQLATKEVLEIWGEMIGRQDQPEVAEHIFQLTADIFFHRLTEENINYQWLSVFLKEIDLFIKEVNKRLPA